MNNLHLTDPKNESKEDRSFLLRQVLRAQGSGNKIRFSICKNPEPNLKPHPRGWVFLCDFTHKEGFIFASEGGDTRREALEKVLSVVVAARLDGAKV